MLKYLEPVSQVARDNVGSGRLMSELSLISHQI